MKGNPDIVDVFNNNLIRPAANITYDSYKPGQRQPANPSQSQSSNQQRLKYAYAPHKFKFQEKQQTNLSFAQSSKQNILCEDILNTILHQSEYEGTWLIKKLSNQQLRKRFEKVSNEFYLNKQRNKSLSTKIESLNNILKEIGENKLVNPRNFQLNYGIKQINGEMLIKAVKMTNQCKIISSIFRKKEEELTPQQIMGYVSPQSLYRINQIKKLFNDNHEDQGLNIGVYLGKQFSPQKQSENLLLNKEIVNLKTQLKKQQLDFISLKNQVDFLYGHNNQLKNDIQILNANFNKVIQENNNLNKLNEDHIIMLDQCKKQINQNNRRYQEKDLQSNKSKEESSKQSIRQYTQQNSKLKVQIQTLNLKLQLSQSKQMSAQKRLESQQKSYTDLKDQLEREFHHHNQLISELQIEKNQSIRLNLSIQQWIEKINDFQRSPQLDIFFTRSKQSLLPLEAVLEIFQLEVGQS